MSTFLCLALCAEFLLAFFLLWREGLFDRSRYFVVACIFLFAAFILRLPLLPHETDDYLGFLARWVEFFRQNGGFSALGLSVGNYNPPYLYFLALFSYIGIDDLYLIKALSILFDVLLAWACMKLVSRFTESAGARIACFLIVMLLPTVILNGAYWAQCDSIYAFFAVYGLYLALSGKPAGSVICIAVSLAFKLQAVFIMPVWFVLLLAKKISWKHLLIFPVAYVVFMLPAVAAGRDLAEVLTLYINQAGTVGDGLNYNSPSVFSIIGWYIEKEPWSDIGIIAAFVFMLAIFFAAFKMRRRLTDALIVGFAVVLVIGIPYLLPHMHDRYFFLADVLSVTLACGAVRYFALPGLCQFASLLSYYAYLNMRYLVHPRIGGEAMLAALVIALLFLLFRRNEIVNKKI